MGLGKTYSADYLIDSNGNTGVSGQVLISTATGIDWADGSAITGGPFLPLAGGTITGNVRFNDTFKAEFGSSADLQINHDATDSLINNATGHLTIRNGANDKNIFLQADNGSGGNTSYLTLNGASTHAYFSNPGNVGIGTTSPSQKLTVVGNTYVSSGLLLLDNNQDIRWGDAGERITGHNTNGLVFTTNNFETMRINSQGKVGIGTTDPGSLLQVGGLDDGSNYDITLGWNAVDSEAVGTKRSAITFKTGQTSVNTEDIYKWDIAMLAAPATVTNEEFGSDLAFLRSTRGSTATDATTMILTRTGNVGIGHTVLHQKFTVNGNIDIRGGDGCVLTFNNGDGGIGVHYNNANSVDGRDIAFKTYKAGVGNTEKMRIDRDGNVGIGDTSPTQISANTFSLSVNSSRTDLSGGLISKANGTVKHQQYWDTGGYNFALSASSGDFKFTGGNVGIGTTAPGAKLDINGIPWVNPADGTHSGWNFRQGGVFKGWVGYVDSNDVVNLSMDGSITNGVNVNASHNVGIGTASPTHKLHVNGDMRLTGALRDSNNAKGSAGQVLSSTGSATDWIPLPATPTIYTPKVFNLNNSTNINSQGQKLVPDFGTLEIEGNTTIQQVSGSDTDFQVTGENTGIYEVTYAVFYKNTGNQRTPLGTYLTLNGTAVNGSLMVNYVRSNVAGGGNFSSCTNTFYVNVTDASHPIALCVRRADSSTAPSGISMVEPAGMAVKSTISFRRIS